MWPMFDGCGITSLEIASQPETLDHISTIAGSVAESFGTISHVSLFKRIYLIIFYLLFDLWKDLRACCETDKKNSDRRDKY